MRPARPLVVSLVGTVRRGREKLWSALTDAEFMKQYWFGMHCESQWTAGSLWKLVSGDGHIFDDGEIVEAEPSRRLVIRWQHLNRPELKAEGESQALLTFCVFSVTPFS